MGLISRVSSALITARNAKGIVDAYGRSPDRTVKGLVKEALGIEDPYIELGKIEVAADNIRRMTGDRSIDVVLGLGSGLGEFTELMTNRQVIPKDRIPGLVHPRNKVSGHAGNIVVGDIGIKTVAAIQGREHLYQGVTPREAVRALRALLYNGARYFVVSNAAGGINPSYSPGDFMVIHNHDSAAPYSPLVGPNIDKLGDRFPDMTDPYSLDLIELAFEIAEEQGILDRLRKGVYFQKYGPEYETRHQIQKLLKQGVGAVGMSTVPEVIAAKHFIMHPVGILGITLITNLAAGISKTPLAHPEVEAEAKKAQARFQPFVEEIIRRLPVEPRKIELAA